MNKQLLIPAAVLLALGAGIAALPTTAAFAQAANAPVTTQNQPPHRDFAAFLERRIGHLKTRLKITPAQEGQFNQVAQVMRDNAADTQKAFADLRAAHGQHPSAIDRLQTNIQLTQLRASHDQRYLDAFQPLYSSLSADQKQIADRLMAPHRFGHFRGRG